MASPGDLGRREPEEAEESLELVGQELVPVGAKGKGNSGGKRSAEELDTPRRSTSGRTALQEGSRGREGKGDGEEQWAGGPRGDPVVLEPLFNEAQMETLTRWRREAPLIHGTRMDQERPRHLPEPMEAGMELAGATSRMSPAARMPVENQEYVMRLVNELTAQNQCLMREIESLKNGKAVEESYGTPDSRDKSKVLSIEDKKSGDNSRKPMEVMGGNVDVSYGQNVRDQGMNPDMANGKSNGGEHEDDDESSSELRPASVAGSGKNGKQMDVILKLLEGMQAMQQQLMGGAGKGNQETAEVVRPGITELPKLSEPTAESGPIDLGDWMIIIEPLLADLSDSSAEWWQFMVTEAKEWYARYLQEHDPGDTSTSLKVKKWSRVERRAVSMLIQAVPEGIRDELISSRAVTTFAVLCKLMIAYQPGGLAEKAVVLRNLEESGEAPSVAEAVKGLRRWVRWRRWVDPAGLEHLDERPDEAHKEGLGGEPGVDFPSFVGEEHTAGGLGSDPCDGVAVCGTLAGGAGTDGLFEREEGSDENQHGRRRHQGPEAGGVQRRPRWKRGKRRQRREGRRKRRSKGENPLPVLHVRQRLPARSRM